MSTELAEAHTNQEKIVPLNPNVETSLDQMDLMKKPEVIETARLINTATTREERLNIVLDGVDLLKKAQEEKSVSNTNTDSNASDTSSPKIISLQAERDRRKFKK